MNLAKYLRHDFDSYIRGNFIKSNCEFCGNDTDLHLHHIDTFRKLLNETLEELNLEEMDTHDYTKMELDLIRNVMIGKQSKCNYITLCIKCHQKLHASDCKKYYNPYGQFVKINIDNIKNLDSDNSIIFRFIYLSTKMDYEGRILFSKSGYNKRYCENYKDFDELLCLSRTEYYNTIKEFKKLKLFTMKDGFLTIDTQYAKRGYSEDDHNIIIFTDSLKELYEKIDNNAHKVLGNVFRNLDILKDNKAKIKLKDYMNLLNLKCHSSVFRKRIYKYISDLVILESNNIFFNPKYIYTGKLDKRINGVIYDFENNKEIENFDINNVPF